MPDVYPYTPTTKGQELTEARCPGVYRVTGPVSMPDYDGFVGWVQVLYYTRDMQAKQCDSARPVRVNPGLMFLRAPGRVSYGGGTESGDCSVERLDGPMHGEMEHFLTQYVRRPGDVSIPTGARALLVNPSRETSLPDIDPLDLTLLVNGNEVSRHLLRTSPGRIVCGGATAIRVPAAPFPSQPNIYWAFHWVMDL